MHLLNLLLILLFVLLRRSRFVFKLSLGSPMGFQMVSQSLSRLKVPPGFTRALLLFGDDKFLTGTGFIKMDNSSGKSFNLDSDSISDEVHASCTGNPATNDWIPASGNKADFVSDKPGRSEN